MNLAAFIAILCSILLVAIAGYLYLNKPEPLALTLTISTHDPVVKAGRDLTATFSIGSNRKADAELNYTILSRAGRKVAFGHQTIFVDVHTAPTIAISIPDATLPGPHWLSARLSGEGASTAAIASFIVTPPATSLSKHANESNKNATPKSPRPPSAEPSTQSPLNASAPEPSNTRASEPSSSKTPPLQFRGFTPSIDEIRAAILAKAVKDPTGAANDCATQLPAQQDTCYSDVALTGKSPATCQRITDLSTKDACLANLALNGDFSVCESIANPDIRDSCIALRGKAA